MSSRNPAPYTCEPGFLGKGLAIGFWFSRAPRQFMSVESCDGAARTDYRGVGREVVARDGGREDDVPWPIKLEIKS